MKDKYILILKSFDDLKFNLGKKTFADFLKGDTKKELDACAK